MKDFESLSGLSIGVIIIILGFFIPKNENFDFRMVIKILGVIIIIISLFFYFKKKQ